MFVIFEIGGYEGSLSFESDFPKSNVLNFLRLSNVECDLKLISRGVPAKSHEKFISNGNSIGS